MRSVRYLLLQDVVNYAYEKLTEKTSKKLPRQYLCTHRNVSMCDVSENNKAVGELYNLLKK